MSMSTTGDPCLDPPVRTALPDGGRIGVVQLVATGTNGGAQEHVYGLLTQIDRARYDVRVISLSDGSAVRRWRALGFEPMRKPPARAARGSPSPGVAPCHAPAPPPPPPPRPPPRPP